jgi:glycosyltransferase involved in cell wall biosynthesis
MPISCSVVIPVWNQGHRLRQIVEEVRAGLGDASHEILLVDNQCTDGCCHGMPNDVLILRTDRRLGTSGAMWFGLSQATGTVIVWCPPCYSAPPFGLRYLANLAARTESIYRPIFASQNGPHGRHDNAGAMGNLQVSNLARRLHIRRLESEVFALQRRLYESLLPYLRMLMLGIPLAVARRFLRIPVVTDAAYTWCAGPKPPSIDLLRRATEVTHRLRWRRDSEKRVRSAGKKPDHTNLAVTAANTASSPPLVTVIITAHNEGQEVRRTLDSVHANTESDHEIIIVDDGSTDGCCDGFKSDHIRIIRHPQRIGIAYSRDEASLLARGKVLAYLDGHQRVSYRCLDLCARAAMENKAIVWPDVRNMKLIAATAHGASMRLCPNRGYITARWRPYAPWVRLSRISTLKAPGYLIPREIYERVHWVRGLRGWGASELAIALKAFFLDIDILHLCGPIASHRFRKKPHYELSWNEIWRNHALIVRVCFDDRTWFNYWLPEVFKDHINKEIEKDLESENIMAQHKIFMAEKLRPDREFWRGMLHVREPSAIKSNS